MTMKKYRWTGWSGLGVGLLLGIVIPETPVFAATPGDERIWASGSRHSDGLAHGRVIYHLARHGDAVYVAGVGRHRGILEKYDAADGTFQWEREQVLGAREGMHIAFDSEFMYVAGTPWSIEKRLPACGSPVWRQTGDGGGKPYTISILADALFLAGTDGNVWRIETE